MDWERSEVWLILALIIEKPSHGYELYQRYERRIGSFVPVSVPRVYHAIERLRAAKLIEPIEIQGSDRRLRHAYRATPKGGRARSRWITRRMATDPELMALLGPIASAGLLTGREMIEVLSAYELKCKREIRALADGAETSTLGELALALGEEARSREWEARRAWAADAREILQSHE
jgi:DNA-binding PadR family transcriptional regulator